MPCKEEGCDKNLYAGPNCKCTPIMQGCENWLGPVKEQHGTGKVWL